MRTPLAAIAAVALMLTGTAFAGEAEIKAAQSTITSQIEAFKAGDEAGAYSYAGPNIKQVFPTVESFMGMVKGAYEPVWHPKSYSFGKSEEMSGTTVVQQVMVVGPDGKDYEAVYTLERDEDGNYRITGVSLRASNSLSA